MIAEIELTDPERPFLTSSAKMLLPRHCLSAPAESGVTSWAGDADRSQQHPLGTHLSQLLLTELSLLCRAEPPGTPSWWETGTAQWNHDLWPAVFWLSSAHQTNPMEYSPGRSWSITITCPRASLQSPVCYPGPWDAAVIDSIHYLKVFSCLSCLYHIEPL